jgi:pimeloyl-ACP methyl ester carboxylesterase
VRGPGRRRLTRLATALALALVGLTVSPAHAAAGPAGLPRLDITRTYVAGFSSGGYMATQLQVAYSSRIGGAAVFSAGPYRCAQDSAVVALQACLEGVVLIDMRALYAQTADYERQQKIDRTANLARSRTYFFHGTLDPTVARSVADHLAEYYRHYDVPLTYRNRLAAGHGWISPLGPVPCAATAAPYMNDCSPYDAQADSLRVLFGAVNAPNTGAPRGRLTTVDQDRYAAAPAPGNGDPTRTGGPAIGLGSTAYLYVPTACAGGAACRLVVALHGCLQTADQIGDTFARRSGLNRYADTNRFVVLYPQARPDLAFGNLEGCWDWWGYLGPQDADYATKSGPQMRTVMAMVRALGG